MSGPDRVPRTLVVAGWVAAAGLVTLGTIARPGPPAARLGPATGRLADGLPPAPNGTGPAAAAPAASPAAAPGAGRAPAGVLAEVEAAFAAGDRAPPGRRGRGRLLPRPLAELRMAAAPLITPRLALPPVLDPDFRALRGLRARARPGEPVHVKLTAYCLGGRTRRGTATRPGVIAADARLFPLAGHVELYAAGRHLGRFRVEDTGGGVRGPHIDIWTPDCADARRFGSRAGVASLVGLGRD